VFQNKTRDRPHVRPDARRRGEPRSSAFGERCDGSAASVVRSSSCCWNNVYYDRTRRKIPRRCPVRSESCVGPRPDHVWEGRRFQRILKSNQPPPCALGLAWRGCGVSIRKKEKNEKSSFVYVSRAICTFVAPELCQNIGKGFSGRHQCPGRVSKRRKSAVRLRRAGGAPLPPVPAAFALPLARVLDSLTVSF
jgi:hypothetical protein